VKALTGLDLSSLEALALALRTGRLRTPFSPAALARHLTPSADLQAVADLLNTLAIDGGKPKLLARFVQALVAERRASRQRAADRVELVWTGPEPVAGLRQTAAVCAWLVDQAVEQLTVVTYAVWPGSLVAALAARMAAVPELSVRLLLNVHHDDLGSGPRAAELSRWAEDFRSRTWPHDQVPEVWFDPRSLAQRSRDRAVLHAKCILVDDRLAFISSANLTDKAHRKNIEAGVLLRDAQLTKDLRGRFDELVARGILERLPGG